MKTYDSFAVRTYRDGPQARVSWWTRCAVCPKPQAACLACQASFYQQSRVELSRMETTRFGVALAPGGTPAAGHDARRPPASYPETVL